MSRPQVSVLLVFVAFAISIRAKTGYGPGDQDWGYVDVREGAHMFYWLYKTTANVANYTDRPLVIWLQGGPGASSTGFGNFEEIGPIDVKGNYRNTTWVKDVNVLFIDNPVGTGFSYVDKKILLTSNNSQIAFDLLQCMKGFYAKHPEFEEVPLHIFSESYGGKMASEFALKLYKAIQNKEIRSNLVSVVLGDPWILPTESVLNWAPLLWNMGVVDADGYESIMAAAYKTLEYTKQGKWLQATNQWRRTQIEVFRATKGVDFYNIEKEITYYHYLRSDNYISYQDLMYRTLVRHYDGEDSDLKLEDLMRNNVSKALGIPDNVIWGSHMDLTFQHLSGDFMKPVTNIVSELLNATSVEVGVISGQLDLICATAGTVNWVNNLSWHGNDAYSKAEREVLTVNNIIEGYKKSSNRFSMYWVLRAGHMVPIDNPAAMNYILKNITNYGL